MLAGQVAHSETWRQATDERIPKIEEKADNHIAYLEALLERLSLAEDPATKQSEAWPKSGKPIVKKTSQGDSPSHSYNALN